ncbi:MAG: HDIG domain-containing protein [Treponema sp.]|nr:HDIG domain-containing protein [Treponema sp.]
MAEHSEPRGAQKPVLLRLFPVLGNRQSALAWGGAFFLSLLVVLLNVRTGRSLVRNLDEFEVGRVAERDVIAQQSLSYRDEEATARRMEAQERQVPAVFQYSLRISEEAQSRWEEFALLAGPDPEGPGKSWEEYRRAIEAAFPGQVSEEALRYLYESPDRELLIAQAQGLLFTLLARGIFSLPAGGLENLNPDVIELIRQSRTRIEQERIPFEGLTRVETIAQAISGLIGPDSPLQLNVALPLLEPFILANAFFSNEDTIQRILEVRSSTEPVMRFIEQGNRIIKRGFVITEEEMAELRVLQMALPANDLPLIFAYSIFLLLLFGLLCFFCGSRVLGRELSLQEVYLVSALSAIYIIGTVLLRNFPTGAAPVSVAIPTALVVILPAILIHSRLALLLAMTLPLGAFLTGSFDAPAYVFATVSGVVASYSLHGAEKRMDLVKAGLIVGAANVIAMVPILLWQHLSLSVFPPALFWGAFNGIASGMLVLGLLPPLEQALNAATAFRLIELSDLNAPALRRLFTHAPGTYSHSIMVSHLAERACQDIGANPLLARVGAYYHDLGKIENPDYFIENQTGYNRHDDMAPLHSATVIRSHVMLGVEKARQLRLPQELINIVGEHHGNSVITWFYGKALKQEGEDPRGVNVEDYSYPGSPPRSRESAVLMLADMTEAAVRTLDKPTPEKLESFIQDLISSKAEQGQLAQSELTFRDLQAIQKAFIQVLSGYYHSRIEYPKIDELLKELSVGSGAAP